MDLIPNWWASKFDSTIPSNNDTDTLFIYGGYIDYNEIVNETDEILLFHLDESLFKIGEVNIDTRIPFSLTNYCKEIRVKKLKEIGQDNSLEEDTFEILPITDISTVHYFNGNNGREMLYVWNGYNPEHISKLDLCDIRSLFKEQSRNYWDIQFTFE